MTRLLDFVFIVWYRAWSAVLTIIGVVLLLWSAIMLIAHGLDFLRFGHFIAVPGNRVAVLTEAAPFIHHVTPKFFHTVQPVGSETSWIGLRWIANFILHVPLFIWIAGAALVSFVYASNTNESLVSFRQQMRDDP